MEKEKKLQEWGEWRTVICSYEAETCEEFHPECHHFTVYTRRWGNQAYFTDFKDFHTDGGISEIKSSLTVLFKEERNVTLKMSILRNSMKNMERNFSDFYNTSVKRSSVFISTKTS